MAAPQPTPAYPALAPIQQLLLIQSIAGHVTVADAEDHVERALGNIRDVLDGRDPVAGDG
ncbi:hypothetical protein [Pseudactinotalea sp. Z1748]|uniref:hypothetical protein n=1 Tax=Pseudactinotalea sp. Z1748 TaxID=3413027 RepID=UPI003C7EBDC5